MNHPFSITKGIVVPRDSRQVTTFLEEGDARLVSDLIPTAAITESFPLSGDRLDSIEWMNTPVPEAFGSYVLVDMAKENSFFTRLFFVSSTALLAFKQSFTGRTNLQVPDELVSVEVLWQESFSEGESDSDWQGAAIGSNISLSGSEDGSGQSSASVTPELSIVTKQIWARNLKTQMLFFLMPTTAGTITDADVIARISSLFGLTVTNWPVFHPKTYVVALIGGKVSVQAGARANEHVTIGTDTSYSIVRGQSSGFDHSDTTAVRVIPNVLCAGFTVTDSRTRDVTATAAVGWASGTNWAAVSVDKTVTGSATGSVSGNLQATTPTAVPTSGNYLLNVELRPFTNFSGYVMVHAEVFDASQLAE